VPSGALATSRILKPAVAGLDDHDLDEHLCLDAARRAGLVTARTRAVRFGDRSAIVVDLCVRRETRGRLVRIHQEDLCQALGVHPSRKCQNEGGPGPALGGTDAHAKDHALLLAGRDVRLAPLYDVASALPHARDERELRIDPDATPERVRRPLARRLPDLVAERSARLLAVMG